MILNMSHVLLSMLTSPRSHHKLLLLINVRGLQWKKCEFNIYSYWFTNPCFTCRYQDCRVCCNWHAIQLLSTYIYIYNVCVCVCVCVYERQRERLKFINPASDNLACEKSSPQYFLVKRFISKTVRSQDLWECLYMNCCGISQHPVFYSINYFSYETSENMDENLMALNQQVKEISKWSTPLSICATQI